jgi:hypothetical protein
MGCSPKANGTTRLDATTQERSWEIADRGAVEAGDHPAAQEIATRVGLGSSKSANAKWHIWRRASGKPVGVGAETKNQEIHAKKTIQTDSAGKGARDRVAPLGRIACRILEAYLNGIRPNCWADATATGCSSRTEAMPLTPIPLATW